MIKKRLIKCSFITRMRKGRQNNMEALAMVFSFIAMFFFLRGLFNLFKHIMGKVRQKDTTIAKRKAKQSGIAFVSCYIVAIVAGVLSGSIENAYTLISKETITEKSVQEDDAEEIIGDTVYENGKESVQESMGEVSDSSNTKAGVENENDADLEQDIIDSAESDFGEKGEAYEEYEDSEEYEDNEEFGIDPDIAAEQEEWEYTVEEMDQKALTYTTLLDYSYKDADERKKIITLIQESKNAAEKFFSYVSEAKKWMSDKKEYKLTTIETEYIYYGKTKNSKPDGYGILYYEQFPVYAGEFKAGQKEGYGIDIENSLDDGYFISYEGEFIHGLRSGKGIEYYEKPDEIVLDSYYHAANMYKREILKYSDLRYDVPLLDNRIVYEGSFKEGKYNGKGTLYRGNGEVEYTGTFNNGDVK